MAQLPSEVTSMTRSEVNRHIRAAEDTFEGAGFFLPEWAHWSARQWKANRDQVKEIVESRLGWDLTDFGLGRYDEKGLLLFTVRNGTPGPGSRLPYAEKLMLCAKGQVTPMHFHWSKTEDIINRGGGELVLTLYRSNRETEETSEESFTVFRDGMRIECKPGDTIRLQPGQSITLTTYLYHSFWAEGGSCIVGEISTVNDDDADNRFLEAVGRFPSIEEDEPPYRLLCTDYGTVLA